MSMGLHAASATVCRLALLALMTASACAREDELIVEPGASLPDDRPANADAGAGGQTGSAGGSGTAPPLTTPRDAATLDGAVGVSDAGAISPDAAASLACAAEFSACVLASPTPAGSGPCLDRYAECDPGFAQPNDAGIDGVCATKFSACVLEDASRFERCLPMLAGC